MPCTLTGSIEGDRALGAEEAEAQVTKLARMLCSVMRILEEDGRRPLSREVLNWWKQHKKQDRERRAEARAYKAEVARDSNGKPHRIRMGTTEVQLLRRGKGDANIPEWLNKTAMKALGYTGVKVVTTHGGVKFREMIRGVANGRKRNHRAPRRARARVAH
jgi:hypothetical protein